MLINMSRVSVPSAQSHGSAGAHTHGSHITSANKRRSSKVRNSTPNVQPVIAVPVSLGFKV